MTEHDLQVSLYEWMHYQKLPAFSKMFAIPNEQRGGAKAAGHMVAEGLKSGVPDNFLPVSRKGYNGLFMELKWGKNKLSGNQMMWCQSLAAENYLVLVCWTIDQCITELCLYLGLQQPPEYSFDRGQRWLDEGLHSLPYGQPSKNSSEWFDVVRPSNG